MGTEIDTTKEMSEICSAGNLYRVYYMAARGYEFYLRVLQVSLTSERSERVRDTFSTKCSVYYIDIDEMSRFKTTCFIHFRNDEKVVTNR